MADRVSFVAEARNSMAADREAAITAAFIPDENDDHDEHGPVSLLHTNYYCCLSLS